MALTCTAATAEVKGGICLLMPDPAGMDHLVAVTAALARLAQDAEDVVDERIARTFTEGQKVRVVPDGFVYRVAGPAAIAGISGYWLQYLDAKRGSGKGRFVIWGDDLKRLEPTQRSRPLGGDRREWSRAAPTIIDRLSGATTLGNHALLTNRVTLIGSMVDLERFLDETRLLPSEFNGDADRISPLGREFPWGSIDDEGTVYIEHPQATPGEPLIAATRNFPAAYRASGAAPAGSKIFISRWLEGYLQNVETVSRIADRQRVVLITEAASRDRVGPLRREGWTIWEPTPDELLGPRVSRPTGLPCLDRNLHAARRERALRIEHRTAESAELAQCASGLQELAAAVRAIERDQGEVLDERVQEKVSDLWRLLLMLSGWIVAPDEQHDELNTRVWSVGQELTFLSRVTRADLIGLMEEVRRGLVSFLETYPSRTTTPLGEAVLAAIQREAPDLLVFGGTRERDHAREMLGGIFPFHEILAVGEQRRPDAEKIVSCSLMSRSSFARFVDPCPASTIIMIGYDFELETYERRLRWRRATRRSLSPPGDIKRRLTGLPLNEAERQDSAPIVPTPEDAGLDRIAEIARRPSYALPKAAHEADQTREGRLCVFAGCSWTVFTPGHSIAVVDAQDSSHVIVRRVVDDLHPGDRVLVRETGDKDVIRLLAEDDIGPGKYAELWEKGQRWRDALRSISTNPMALWRKLMASGLHRDPVTVRNWLLDDGVIGPRSQDDLSLIVEAADGQPDATSWRECWDAIVRLRGLHMRSGMRLTKVLEEECCDLLFGDAEQEQAIELSLGLLWLVRVTEVQPPAHWPANVVNQLHWGREEWREQMLAGKLQAEGL